MTIHGEQFSIKQIAAQAGVSKATVDRVLHGRGQVRGPTRRRVEQALLELETQQRASLAAGRTLPIDVVMHAPERFTRLAMQAMCGQIGSMAPYRINLRFHLYEDIEVAGLQRVLQRCVDQGTYGVVLKAADELPVNDSVNHLHAQGTPVITLVTDLPQSQRIAYIGMDNRAAGRTAAYLMRQWLGAHPCQIAVVLSSQGFRGEEERESGFRRWLRERAPYLGVVDVSGGYGVYDATLELVDDALRRNPSVTAAYSVGGGNTAIADAFARLKRPLNVLIGHDLDEENRQLLAAGKIAAVIDHDLQQDARQAFLTILRFHGFIPGEPAPGGLSRVQVITPFNIPAADGERLERHPAG